MTSVVIIDSGGANLASLGYALGRLGVSSIVSAVPEVIHNASHVLLPGVGSAGNAMARLRTNELHQSLPLLTQPLLGICLGMQLLYSRSDEDNTQCLGVLPGCVQRLSPVPGRPVPHMGWNTLRIQSQDPLLQGISASDYLYFVHSYYADRGTHTVASADYGVSLSAVVRHQNFCGVQFHPERSGAAGARLLANFLSS